VVNDKKNRKINPGKILIGGRICHLNKKSVCFLFLSFLLELAFEVDAEEIFY